MKQVARVICYFCEITAGEVPTSAKVKECMELYLHSPNMSSWHGMAWRLVKHRDNFTFTFTAG
jgi:hypothetical protein